MTVAQEYLHFVVPYKSRSIRFRFLFTLLSSLMQKSADFFVSLSLTFVLIFYAALGVILLICPALYKVYKVLKCAAIEPSWTAQVVTISWRGKGREGEADRPHAKFCNSMRRRRTTISTRKKRRATALICVFMKIRNLA